jgi:hypothetical protein
VSTSSFRAEIVEVPMNGLKRALSGEAFARLGAQHLAYVKRIVVRGEACFAVHAADGSLLHQFADRALAEAALRQHDLEPLSLH